MHRQYLAVVVGALVSGGTANAPIDRHPRDRIRMAVRDDGKDAVTHFRLRERFRAHTLLECRLETGRTHQIRVHMAHLKHPIVGGPPYSGSPISGCFVYCMCTRIWCVRPVSSRHSTSVCERKRSLTR